MMEKEAPVSLKALFSQTAAAWCFLLSGALALAFASGCGGGGAVPSAQIPAAPGAAPPPAGRVPFRTVYRPATSTETFWTLFQASGGDWNSAINGGAPAQAYFRSWFTRVGVRVIPSKTYNNPGQIEFAIDGQAAGTLDMSSEEPFETYKDDYVSTYILDGEVEAGYHTVSLTVSTGTFSFDGWLAIDDDRGMQMLFPPDSYNDKEDEVIRELEDFREKIEAYKTRIGAYPAGPTAGDVINQLYAAGLGTGLPRNPFTGKKMTFSDGYSEGDLELTIDPDGGDLTVTGFGVIGAVVKFTCADAACTDQAFDTLIIEDPTAELPVP